MTATEDLAVSLSGPAHVLLTARSVARTVETLEGATDVNKALAYASLTMAESMWFALTGTTGQAAVDLAESCAARTVHAYTTPF